MFFFFKCLFILVDFFDSWGEEGKNCFSGFLKGVERFFPDGFSTST